MRPSAAAVMLLALAACTGSGDVAGSEPPTCEVRFAAPTGFAPIETFEEPYADHVGLRLGFRDVGDREFHVLVGIPGEIGEGLPEAGELALRDGRSGAMLGDDRVWVVVWREGDRCDPRAVIGNGFSRTGFVAALEDAGIT